MEKTPKPDLDEVFSLEGVSPEDVARMVVNAEADEELDRAEAEGFSESES